MNLSKCFLILALLFFRLAFSQANTTPKITAEFENIKITEVFDVIEDQCDYTFFYHKKWLNDLPLINLKYENASLVSVLNDLFDDTRINYFFYGKKIILTKNNYIRSSISEELFLKANDTIIESDEIPIPLILNKKQNTLSKSKSNRIISIGKESKSSYKKEYLLSGVVRDASTKKPLQNIDIFTSDKSRYTTTNKEGYYSLRLPSGLNSIEISSIAIDNVSKKVLMFNNGNLDFNVVKSTEFLNEVVVKSVKKNTRTPATGITQVNVEKIKTIPLVLGERDILKVASTFPGIKKAGEGSFGYNVRGGKVDQNLILLDQAVLYNASHFFGIFSAINPFTTGNVDIYKGYIPANYGGRISSVFNIETKKINDEKFSGEGAIGPVTSNLKLEIPIKKNNSAVLVGARGTYSNWILRQLDEKSLKKSKASFYDIIAKYEKRINKKNSINTTAYFSKDNFSVSSDSIINYSNRLFSLKWNYNISSKKTLELMLSNSQYKFGIDYLKNTSNNSFDLNYDISDTKLLLSIKHLIGENHKLNYGISSKLYSINPGNISPKGNESQIESLKIPTEKAIESSVFLSDNYEVNERMSLDFGIRYSLYALLGKYNERIYNSNFPRSEESMIDVKNYANNELVKTYGGPEFRASLRYFITPDFSVKTSFGNTYQYIHMLTNNTTASPTDKWKLSDTNIKPQKSNQLSLGFYKDLSDGAFELSLEGYYKKSKNLLDYKIGASLLLNEAVEADVLQGDGKSYGVEFLIKKNEGKLNGWLGYSYSRSFLKLNSDFNEEKVNNGNYFPSNFDKPHDFSLVANYKLTKRFSLSTNFSYQTGRPVTYPVGKFVFNNTERVLYSDRNKFRIPDYYRLDIGINIEGNHKIKKLAHSFWNISIYNVLGRNNPYSVFFVSENNEIKAYKSSIFSVPIPTITYNFKF